MLELVFHVKAAKHIHKELIAIDATCIKGSSHRIKRGECCLIFVCNESAQKAIHQALESPITSTWTQLPENLHLSVLIDPSKTLERNRKGVKLVECEQVVSVSRPIDKVSQISSESAPLQRTDSPSLKETPADIIHDKKERHRIFARWLVETFGMDALSTGSGVLDVAGGNGELSHALASMGIPSILLDPNPRCETDVSFSIVAEALHGDGSAIFSRNDPTGRLVKQCCLIAGMHPDQATESIVDMALCLNVPFALLPCCVMPALFPHRRQKSSNDPVRSYSAFCQYLLDKAPRHESFQVVHLPFAGRNKVIFRKIQ